jgi:protein SCO1/2
MLGLPRWQAVSLIAVLAVIIGGAAYLVGGGQPLPRPPTAGSALPAGGDFALHSSDGPIRLADFRGKAVLLYFGYTSCPDACPTMLGLTAQALALLQPEELAQLQPLFIAIDPDRDTPPRIKEYASFFHPKLRAATGSAAEIAAVARQYGVYYRAQETNSAGGYTVDHSSSLYLIDRTGQLRRVLPHGTPPDQIAAAVRALF